MVQQLSVMNITVIQVNAVSLRLRCMRQCCGPPKSKDAFGKVIEARTQARAGHRRSALPVEITCPRIHESSEYVPRRGRRADTHAEHTTSIPAYGYGAFATAQQQATQGPVPQHSGFPNIARLVRCHV